MGLKGAIWNMIMRNKYWESQLELLFSPRQINTANVRYQVAASRDRRPLRWGKESAHDVQLALCDPVGTVLSTARPQ